jgi:hypothetical protein
MKKLIILSIILILGLSIVAYARVTKVVFFPYPAGATGEHENASGFAIINETPEGDTTTVVQIQVRDAAASFTYFVWSNGESRGSFTTNKKGSGNFHLNLSPEDTELGEWITIRTSDEIPEDNLNLNLVLVCPH